MNIIQSPTIPEVDIPEYATIGSMITNETRPLCVPDISTQCLVINLQTPCSIAYIAVDPVKEVQNLRPIHST